VNFIKQFVAAGLSKDIQLIRPVFLRPGYHPRRMGDRCSHFRRGALALDLDNAANKKFVAEFEKEYKRLPTVYASQGYDTRSSSIRRARSERRIENTEACSSLQVGAYPSSPARSGSTATISVQNYYSP